MQEKAFGMGETLPGAKIPYLDINREKSVIQEKLRSLHTQKLSEREITLAMKDFGIERLLHFLVFFSCLYIVNIYVCFGLIKLIGVN